MLILGLQLMIVFTVDELINFRNYLLIVYKISENGAKCQSVS